MVRSGTLLSERYLLEERIATGGMGSVYEASDRRLGRRVAVKLMKDELAEDERFVERFRREARAVAALSHPNIAAVFDYGEDDSCNFIVMEHVEGKDLARLLREEGPISAERAVRIAAQVCDALQHAHSAGVVHRDVKPANVIVGAGDRVKVTDFGIARAIGDATLTATGSVLGTAHYVSPEQAGGTPVGPQADIYSLGIVLYEMLTGALPFTGDSPIAVAMRHVSDDMPAPSDVNPDIPASLDDVVERATAKDPNDRFLDASSMAAALRQAVEPETTAPLAGAGATLPLAATGGAASSAQTVWPIPGGRWNPHRIGRWVLIVFGALLLIAAGLLVARLAGGERSPEPAAPASETTDEADRVVIPNNIVGFTYEQAKEELEDLGLVVRRADVENDAPQGVVVDSEPGVLEPVTVGETVTLFVSKEEDNEDKDEDEDGSRGKGRGKDKGKDDD